MAFSQSRSSRLYQLAKDFVHVLEGDFPNEDATRFDLVDELYTMPAKMPTSMFQFAAWLEE